MGAERKQKNNPDALPQKCQNIKQLLAYSGTSAERLVHTSAAMLTACGGFGVRFFWRSRLTL